MMRRVVLFTSDDGKSFDIEARFTRVGMTIIDKRGVESEMEDVVEIEQDGAVIYLPLASVQQLATTLGWERWGAQQEKPRR